MRGGWVRFSGFERRRGNARDQQESGLGFSETNGRFRLGGDVSLKELAGVIIVGGRQPDADAAEAAEKEGVPIFTTAVTAFEVAGRLYEMGLRSSPPGDDG